MEQVSRCRCRITSSVAEWELVGQCFDVVDDVGDLRVGEIVVGHHHGVADTLLLVGILDRFDEVLAVDDTGFAALEGNGLADDALPRWARTATKVGAVTRCTARLLGKLQTLLG